MWDLLVINPMVNALLWLYGLLFNNFFLAIAVFTLLIRLATLPLQLRQQRASARMQEMQPQIQAIQKKYRDNPQKLQEEFRKIGYNPAETLTGCLPLVIQFPILIGLYQAIILVLGATPQALFDITDRLAPSLTSLLPVTNKFVWLNLAQPDPFFVLPIVVLATTFLQQKVLTPPTPPTANGKDNPAASMNRSLQYTMPLMFGVFSLQFPAGLSLYFILSNLIGLAMGMMTKKSMTAHKAGPQAASTTRATSNGESVEKAPIVTKSKEAAPGPNRVKSNSNSENYGRRTRTQSQSKRKRRSAGR